MAGAFQSTAFLNYMVLGELRFASIEEKRYVELHS
jgi:hypothetical protein